MFPSTDGTPKIRQRKLFGKPVPDELLDPDLKTSGAENDGTDPAGQESPIKKKTPASPGSKLAKEDAYSPYVDILRVLTFLLLASCGLSYLVSGGETWFWGMKNPPKYMQLRWWKLAITGPMYLTPEELSIYNGTDPNLPIYLAINHTIYDVTAGRRIYGPGGSYNYFAGVDASRAYVTGCFAEDRTPDMRGVEEMFLPLEDSRIERKWPAGELAQIRIAERKEAKQKVHDALKHWVDFFAKSKKYHFVGYVRREEGWLKKMKRRALCERAGKTRKLREPPATTNPQA